MLKRINVGTIFMWISSVLLIVLCFSLFLTNGEVWMGVKSTSTGEYDVSKIVFSVQQVLSGSDISLDGAILYEKGQVANFSLPFTYVYGIVCFFLAALTIVGLSLTKKFKGKKLCFFLVIALVVAGYVLCATAAGNLALNIEKSLGKNLSDAYEGCPLAKDDVSGIAINELGRLKFLYTWPTFWLLPIISLIVLLIGNKLKKRIESKEEAN